MTRLKTEIQLPKNVKFHFYLVFWAILWFDQQFQCEIYVWRCCGPNLIFFQVIFNNFVFSDKKHSNCKNFAHIWFSWSSMVNKILRFCSCDLTPNKFWTKCLKCLVFAKTTVFHPYFLEITTFISIWLQLTKR